MRKVGCEVVRQVGRVDVGVNRGSNSGDGDHGVWWWRNGQSDPNDADDSGGPDGKHHRRWQFRSAH